MKINHNTFSRKKLLALAVPMLVFGQAHAVQFDFGDAAVTVDSQLSIGSSWRMEDQNENLLDYSNEGNFDNNTANDGNLNYDKGDAVTQVFKGNHDIQFTYQNFGAFVRGKYWYDSVIENNSVNHGHGPTFTKTIQASNYQLIDITTGRNQKLDDSNFDELSKGSGAVILDAFIYGSFDVGEIPLDLRLGKQVVSWGEGIFIRGGINAINPADVSAFRRPGAEVKEGLIPVNMVYANLGLTDSLSFEAFYQLEYKESVGDGCGTFFSTSDPGTRGCNEQVFDIAAETYATMSKDSMRTASDDGQFGIAARYFSDDLDAEFGFYAMNIHSRSPNYSTKWSPTYFPQDMRYIIEYVEDTKLVGFSFAGNIHGVAVAGEVTHKMDAPVQINTTTLALATLASGVTTGTQEKQDVHTAVFASRDAITNEIRGYDRFNITQITTSATHLVNNILGASRLTFITEAGLTYVHDFNDELFYGRSSIYPEPQYDGSDSGYMTETTFGYRILAAASYTNAFVGVDLTPIITFSHDVDGYGTAQDAAFQEDNKALGFTIKANYLQRYDASIGYTMYMGGDFNPAKDRDFLSISAGVQF